MYKKILGNIEHIILSLLGFGIILVIGVLFLLPYYQEHNYIKDCLQNRHTEEWCKQTWQQLQELD